MTTPRGSGAPKVPGARGALDPAHREAVRRAGAWGLGLCSTGVGTIVAVGVVALIAAALDAVVREILGEVPGLGDAVRVWRADVDETAWVVAAALVLVFGVGLVTLGMTVSIRVLRRAGIAQATAITRWCCVVGVLVQAALSLATAWVLPLLGLIAGGAGLAVVLILSTAVSASLSALIGYLAGPALWAARIRRVVQREAAVVPGVVRS